MRKSCLIFLWLVVPFVFPPLAKAQSSEVFSCLADCTAHGCFLSCQARRPSYGEAMRFPQLPSFDNEAACKEACTCERYPVGPRLPNGEASCQERD